MAYTSPKNNYVVFQLQFPDFHQLSEVYRDKSVTLRFDGNIVTTIFGEELKGFDNEFARACVRHNGVEEYWKNSRS